MHAVMLHDFVWVDHLTKLYFGVCERHLVCKQYSGLKTAKILY